MARAPVDQGGPSQARSFDPESDTELDIEAVRDAPGPTPLGRFLIERELGRGGFGVVYLAYDEEMGRDVALKLPRADALITPDIRRRFLREAHAAARLDHPNLVAVYDAGEIGPICYIASAFCDGTTLGRWLESRSEPVPIRQAARLVRALARGVTHAHARRILHCDLKPGNVLLVPPTNPGEDPVPRITDFGLAKLLEAPPSESTAARPLGTPPYMAPEQVEGQGKAIGPATDVYALGAILYEVLTGRPPHSGATNWETMRAVVTEPPARPRRLRRAIPRDLEAICLRCLEKRPDDRYATAAGLAEDLERFLNGRTTRARPLSPPRRLVRWARRYPSAATLAGMGLLILVVSVGYSLALSRAVARLDRTNVHLKEALQREQEILRRERRLRYVSTLALAQADVRDGRIEPAQQHLRGFEPVPGEVDDRDFAWHYLYRQTAPRPDDPQRSRLGAPRRRRGGRGRHADGLHRQWDRPLEHPAALVGLSRDLGERPPAHDQPP